MAIAPLKLIPAPRPVAQPCLAELVARVEECLATAASIPTEGLDDEGLGAAVAALARIESRAASLRMGLSAEADRRRVAEQTAETGADAWVARLTGAGREAAAGGLRIARLLAQKYPATREAFAAGALRV